ncbi:RNA polymerase sigma factor RpoE [Acidithiobacillus sp. CV18-2]|uniref:RNA polymerase sigma factor n=1 Tax=Igneacidithiobacillus copahuensis TaxID=2724909 RepID=A0AAE3CJE6_9PROT|nr:RNA polymerase sigma factor RpoE [Igneacidithiobacillus copahuensis]MBU2754317.1 RNA polymerase sigma factor RpoE [Acidithiobacillus sp. CV18-3]MBU2757660.1 RNA polymerase sigma factor RpoE [Acidithiobacillus sp. BN09-2]MBU2777025.1 RNA polymerase sigma factor RpoE [Acidithiobacillus sp. CV18-2]MBU2797329.1 RNA polymerase sigma factor RpoE [Acidithiobacillus sp. VAN18-2]MBU2799824.1 RNA polymerase sigma factor RpoE [Acidithiobacillus sp. VAN18-4]MDD3760725.1 RNA polymerase sigma factor Rpo
MSKTSGQAADSAKDGGAQTDLLLVQRVQKGERQAFDLLVRKYQHKVVALIGRFVRQPEEAEDVAQEAFVKAYRALHNFRGDSAFYTWLYRIAVNTAKNHLVAQGRKVSIADVDTDEAEQFDSADGLREYDTPEGLLLTKEIAQHIDAALKALPADLREAVSLRELEGLSYDEIAQVMDCPVGTVRSRIFRAREAIAKVLAPLLEQSSHER